MSDNCCDGPGHKDFCVVRGQVWRRRMRLKNGLAEYIDPTGATIRFVVRAPGSAENTLVLSTDGGGITIEDDAEDASIKWVVLLATPEQTAALAVLHYEHALWITFVDSEPYPFLAGTYSVSDLPRVTE